MIKKSILKITKIINFFNFPPSIQTQAFHWNISISISTNTKNFISHKTNHRISLSTYSKWLQCEGSEKNEIHIAKIYRKLLFIIINMIIHRLECSTLQQKKEDQKFADKRVNWKKGKKNSLSKIMRHVVMDSSQRPFITHNRIGAIILNEMIRMAKLRFLSQKIAQYLLKKS